jgi:hypothetical protein
VGANNSPRDKAPWQLGFRGLAADWASVVTDAAGRGVATSASYRLLPGHACQVARVAACGESAGRIEPASGEFPPDATRVLGVPRNRAASREQATAKYGLAACWRFSTADAGGWTRSETKEIEVMLQRTSLSLVMRCDLLKTSPHTLRRTPVSVTKAMDVAAGSMTLAFVGGGILSMSGMCKRLRK